MVHILWQYFLTKPPLPVHISGFHYVLHSQNRPTMMAASLCTCESYCGARIHKFSLSVLASHLLWLDKCVHIVCADCFVEGLNVFFKLSIYRDYCKANTMFLASHRVDHCR